MTFGLMSKRPIPEELFDQWLEPALTNPAIRATCASTPATPGRAGGSWLGPTRACLASAGRCWLSGAAEDKVMSIAAGRHASSEPPGGWSSARPTDRSRRFVLAVILLAGLFITAAGVAALLAPGWFADAAAFPRHTHFVHDAGAFQLGIGATLLPAVAWRDGLALALTGSLVANTTHAVNHAVDLHLGGRSGDPWGLAALSLPTAAALVVRLGQLGRGGRRGRPAASPVLARFARQKTMLVTQQPQGGHRAVDGSWLTDRPGHAGHIRGTVAHAWRQGPWKALHSMYTRVTLVWCRPTRHAADCES
jgi:hypothetical protein